MPQATFSFVFTLYYTDLVNFAFTFTRDRDTAEEIVQDLFVRFWENRDSVSVNTSLKSFLLRSVQNKCIDRIREKQQEPRPLEQEPVKSESVEISSETETLSKAIERLPDEHKTLIMFRFGQGLQIGQIAAMLNIAEGTVKSRLHRALARLREILGDTI